MFSLYHLLFRKLFCYSLLWVMLIIVTELHIEMYDAIFDIAGNKKRSLQTNLGLQMAESSKERYVAE